MLLRAYTWFDMGRRWQSLAGFTCPWRNHMTSMIRFIVYSSFLFFFSFFILVVHPGVLHTEDTSQSWTPCRVALHPLTSLRLEVPAGWTEE
jgi:hypothetical protein